MLLFSILDGGLTQSTKYVYTTANIGGIKNFIVDSSTNNFNKIAPRKYYGADAQLKIKNKVGYTELRGEFITGKQTASATSSENTRCFFCRHRWLLCKKF
ncbi:MAG: hypothetical protein WDM90_22790 [Ferruginibacter sp.]